MEYNFSNVLLIVHVEFFYNKYNLKLLLTKVVGGPLFSRHNVYHFFCMETILSCNTLSEI